MSLSLKRYGACRRSRTCKAWSSPIPARSVTRRWPPVRSRTAALSVPFPCRPRRKTMASRAAQSMTSVACTGFPDTHQERWSGTWSVRGSGLAHRLGRYSGKGQCDFYDGTALIVGAHSPVHGFDQTAQDGHAVCIRSIDIKPRLEPGAIVRNF